MDDKLVSAVLYAVEREAVRVIHIFGKSDFHTVEENLRHGVNAVKTEKGVKADGFIKLEAGVIIEMQVFVFLRFNATRAEINVGQKSLAHKIELKRSGDGGYHARQSVSLKVGGGRHGDAVPSHSRIFDIGKLPALYSRFLFHKLLQTKMIF